MRMLILTILILALVVGGCTAPRIPFVGQAELQEVDPEPGKLFEIAEPTRIEVLIYDGSAGTWTRALLHAEAGFLVGKKPDGAPASQKMMCSAE
jgi:hypothetical protein